MPYLRDSDGNIVGHITIAVRKDCYNLYESFGEICVGCDCCARDKRIRYEARLALHERLLERAKNFNLWAYEYPELMEMQKKNVAADIQYNEKKIEMYKRKLERLKAALEQMERRD